jgi:hypothetical protein
MYGSEIISTRKVYRGRRMNRIMIMGWCRTIKGRRTMNRCITISRHNNEKRRKVSNFYNTHTYIVTRTGPAM